jgi:hypothetical protein
MAPNDMKGAMNPFSTRLGKLLRAARLHAGS